MANIKATLATANGWLKSLTEFGLTIVLAFVVLDILFPGSTGIISNISELVSSFAGNGVTGLIALLLFMMIYKK